MRPVENSPAVPPYAPTSCGPASPETLRDAQEALTYLGVADVPRSGVLDRETIAALLRFQREQGLQETGCLDDRTLHALLEAAVDRSSATAHTTPAMTTAVAPRPDTRVNIHFRTFAPFRDFGGGFDGDNRSFSLDASASSRMRTRVEVSTREQSARIHHSTSGTRHASGIGGTRYAETEGTANIERVSEGVSRMTFEQSGANPLTPSLLTPSIDRRAEVTLDERTPGILRLHIEAHGDDFPHAEMTISDITGQTLFLDGFATRYGEHGPFSLENVDRAQLLAADLEVLVDGRGRFMGVVLPGGEPMSIEEWNRQRIRAEREEANANDAGRQWF